jgi:hypothetical protein
MYDGGPADMPEFTMLRPIVITPLVCLHAPAKTPGT